MRATGIVENCGEREHLLGDFFLEVDYFKEAESDKNEDKTAL